MTGWRRSTSRPGRHVVIPQINVTRNQTLSIAAAQANSEVTMATPRPGTALDTNADIQRTGVKGSPIELEFYSFSPEWFNTTRPSRRWAR